MTCTSSPKGYIIYTVSVFPRSHINILFNLREHKTDVWEGRTDKRNDYFLIIHILPFFKYQAATPSFVNYTARSGNTSRCCKEVIAVVVGKILVTCCYNKLVKCSLNLRLVLISHKTMSGVGVTLDELLEEEGVTPAQLDKACTSEHLKDIALFLESWRTVAPHLGLSNVDAEEVERDGTEEKEKRQKILQVWKARLAFKATYIVLVKALLKIGRADLAEQVCHLLVQQHKEGIPFSWGGGCWYVPTSVLCLCILGQQRHSFDIV